MTLFANASRAARTHLTKWSPEILAVIAPILRDWQLPVHDPFAGTGERLGTVCDQLGLRFTGTEIEPEFARAPRLGPGDSTDPTTYPNGRYCSVTSPADPNGMSDHFKAGDNSRRHTYRQALAQILGHDRELHPNNMGRYGARQLARHYAIADRCVGWWPEHAIVNVSDFIVAGAVHRCVDRWREILERRGYDVTETIEVETPRQRQGANADARVNHEAVLIAVRRRRMMPGDPSGHDPPPRLACETDLTRPEAPMTAHSRPMRLSLEGRALTLDARGWRDAPSHGVSCRARTARPAGGRRGRRHPVVRGHTGRGGTTGDRRGGLGRPGGRTLAARVLGMAPCRACGAGARARVPGRGPARCVWSDLGRDAVMPVHDRYAGRVRVNNEGDVLLRGGVLSIQVPRAVLDIQPRGDAALRSFNVAT
jgi:hypothetical protein